MVNLGEDFLNFNRFYYYSISQDDKIITADMGSMAHNLLLKNWGENNYIEDVDFRCIKYDKSLSDERRSNKLLENHLERISQLKVVKKISLQEAEQIQGYLVNNIRSSY